MKDLILKELIEKKGCFISGQELSKKYQITRAGIWKYMQKFKEEGYEIESVSNKGYRLISEPDKLETIHFDFDENWLIGKEYIYLDKVDSTNDYAKKIAAQKPDGSVILAEKQEKGKGRLGRGWNSGYKTGIWMSFILKPDIITSDAVMVTQIAAAAVVKGINEAVDCDAKIKWPNDIVVGNKKVCGILTELSGEIESLNYIIVGIGINVNQNASEFPEEIKDKATSLNIFTGKEVSRKKILISVLSYFDAYYKQFLKNHSLEGIIDVCKDYSATLNKRVRILHNGNESEGKAIGMTERGGLLVEDLHGNISEIISGEVSVRGLYNYAD